MNSASPQDLLRDADSGAYRLAFLQEFATKEIDRARRYGRSFSVVTLSVAERDPLYPSAQRERVEPRKGPDGARELARSVVAAVSRVIRDADVLARAPDGAYRVLLPETDRLGALMLVRRASDEIRREPQLRGAGRWPLVAGGAATFPADGGDLDELLQACRRREDDHRASLVQRLPATDTSDFWQLASKLLAPEDPIHAGRGAAVPAREQGGASRSASLAVEPAAVEAMRREVLRDVGRDVRARGVLYATVPSTISAAALVAALPKLEGAARAGDVGTRVVLLGPRHAVSVRTELLHPLVSYVPVDADERVADTALVLLLSERTAYALLSRPGGATFHSSDVALVDLLVTRLQAAYELQPI